MSEETPSGTLGRHTSIPNIGEPSASSGAHRIHKTHIPENVEVFKTLDYWKLLSLNQGIRDRNIEREKKREVALQSSQEDLTATISDVESYITLPEQPTDEEPTRDKINRLVMEWTQDEREVFLNAFTHKRARDSDKFDGMEIAVQKGRKELSRRRLASLRKKISLLEKVPT